MPKCRSCGCDDTRRCAYGAWHCCRIEPDLCCECVPWGDVKHVCPNFPVDKEPE